MDWALLPSRVGIREKKWKQVVLLYNAEEKTEEQFHLLCNIPCYL